MREVWRWGINPEEPAYKRTILLSLLGQEDPICADELLVRHVFITGLKLVFMFSIC